MAVETNNQGYSQSSDVYPPAWWDQWLKKNLKKQTKLFAKQVKSVK